MTAPYPTPENIQPLHPWIAPAPDSRRDVPAPVSRGWQTSIGFGSPLNVLKHESSQSRKVRLQPLGLVLPQGNLLFATIEHGIDGGVTTSRVLIPAQGVAVQVPAGQISVSVERLVDPFDPSPDLTTQVELRVSAANEYPCNRTVVQCFDSNWSGLPGNFPLVPPPFATFARLASVGNPGNCKFTFEPNRTTSTTINIASNPAGTEPTSVVLPATNIRVDSLSQLLTVEWQVTE